MPRAKQVNWQSFAPITTHDHAGYIWIAVLYCAVVSSMIFASRTWIKKNIWGRDDTAFATAFIALIGHVGAIVFSLKNGFGTIPANSRNPETQMLVEGGSAEFAAEIFLVLAMTLAKCSLLLFIMRLLARDSMQLRRVCYASLGLIASWGIGSIVALAVNCSPSKMPVNDAGRRWAGIAAFDAATEVLLIGLPIALVWPLQMALKTKLQVASAFILRLGVAGLAIAHATYIVRYEERKTPNLIMVPAVVVAEGQLCWSLVTATIPNMKAFLQSFNTGFRQDFGMDTITHPQTYGSHWRSRSRDGGIPLSDMQKCEQNANPPPESSTDLDINNASYIVQVAGACFEDAHSVSSGGSSKMIIRKNTTTTVEHRTK